MKDGSTFWDKTAKKYAAKPVPSQEVYEEKLKLTRELFTPDMNVLEIGCGTGTTALIHAPNVNSITATDFTTEMIKIAKEKAKDKNQTNIRFAQESVQEMDYPKNEFDIIMAHSILHLVEERELVLSKIYHSLRPGGYFVTSTGCIGGVFKIFKPLWYLGFLIGKLPFLGWFTKSELKKQVTDLGFTIQKEWSPTKVDIFLIAKKQEQ